MTDFTNDSDDDWSDTKSIDSCEAYIQFESIRDPSTQLEKAVSFSWPGVYQHGDCDVASNEQQKDGVLRKIIISTLLEEDDLAPLFGGCQWAGTRLWGAAVRAIQFLAGNLEIDGSNNDSVANLKPRSSGDNKDNNTTLLELGCGLGVPGMIFHLLGSNVVLTDQEDILTQLEKNVRENFPSTSISNESSSSDATAAQHYIRAMPLSWSRTGVHSLLEQLQLSTAGFDIVLNCDCVFEPLYGKSWHLLNETIDELLRVNQKCVVVSSMERRGPADGIDLFIKEMKEMEYVGSVEKVYYDEKRNIEIYVTRGLE
jgi:predicted nicotinamide N-methyase